MRIHIILGFMALFIAKLIYGAEIQVLDYINDRPKNDLLKFTLDLRDGEKKVREICGEESFNKGEVIHEYLKGRSGNEMILLLRTDKRKNSSGQTVQELVGFMIAYKQGYYMEIEYLCSNDKGGGRELLEALYTHIRNHNYPKLIRLTSLYDARGFYETMGFKKEGFGNDYRKTIK